MRKAILGILLAVLLPGLAAAQRPYTGQGYLFFAPGAVSPGNSGSLHFGGGAQGFVYKGLGAGAELGYLFPRQSIGCGFGLFSANGSYHFNRSSKLVPFVTSGYSLGFRHGVANMLNFGGGVDYWFRQRAGLHLEFRDHIYPCSGCNAHFWGFRVGFSFR